MNEFDDLENTLATELRRRSGDVLTTPGLAGRARRQARTLRRRRAVAAGAATALALVVAVPAVLSLRDGPQTAPPVRPAPTSSTTTELVVDGMRVGAPPSIGYLAGDTFHRTDGSTVELPAGLRDVLEVPGGFYGTSLTATGPEIQNFDESGRYQSTLDGAGPVLSPDGALMAYYDANSGVVWAGPPDGGTGPLSHAVPPGQRVDPVGFLDDHRLVSNVETDAEPWAGVHIDGFGVGPDDGAWETPPWDVLRVGAVSTGAGLVAGMTESSDTGSCWAVFEDGAAEPLWRTCDYSFTRFSLDGRHLLGTAPSPDDEGNPFAVIVNARTGAVVHTYTGRFVHDAAFEDNEHVLISVVLDGGGEREAALLRCDLDGACELAAPVVPADQNGYAYELARQFW
ncbi:hypothetical protein [Jiangella anatolica]|uniref:hypothetical protein n=1 Tax=Jiangella anatolica TaxID=2670374 RepID=UPI001F38E0E7|nr:hypothetical protein [Jiangella anatolica]